MKKYVRFLLILLAGVLLFTACGTPSQNSDETTGSQPQGTDPSADHTPVVGIVNSFSSWRYEARGGVSEEPVAHVITDEEEWNSYRQENFPNDSFEEHAYNEAFFAEGVLIVLYVREQNDSTELKVADVSVAEGKLVVKIERQENRNIVSDGFGYWCIFTEVVGELMPDEDSDVLVETVDLPVKMNTAVTGSVSSFAVIDAGKYALLGENGYEPEISVLDSYAKWEAYCAQNCPKALSAHHIKNRYNATFFESHTVVALRKMEPSGSNRVSVLDAEVLNGKLEITVGRYVPTFGTQDVRAWCLFVELTGDARLDEDSDVTVKTEELPCDTAVTGSISKFTVFNASGYRTVKAIEGGPELFAIGSYAQWKAYCVAYYPDLLSNYDSAYFDTHSIVVYRKVESSGSIEVSVQGVKVEGDRLTVTVERKVPEMGTADVKNWCLLIEITGDVLLDEDSDVKINLVEIK